MNQTKLASFIEACMNTGTGFIISFTAWRFLVAPMFHLPILVSTNLEITGIFTILSISRSYVWRRTFNKELPQKVASSVMRGLNGKHSTAL